jgi:hypothetical protein
MSLVVRKTLRVEVDNFVSGKTPPASGQNSDSTTEGRLTRRVLPDSVPLDDHLAFDLVGPAASKTTLSPGQDF